MITNSEEVKDWVRRNWTGDFISKEQVDVFKNEIIEAGENWNELAVFLNQHYINTECPFCCASGRFKVKIFGRMHCSVCNGVFTFTPFMYLKYQLRYWMYYETFFRIADFGVFWGIVAILFLSPLRIAYALITTPFILLLKDKPGS